MKQMYTIHGRQMDGRWRVIRCGTRSALSHWAKEYLRESKALFTPAYSEFQIFDHDTDEVVEAIR
jgi:hypothetical protein